MAGFSKDLGYWVDMDPLENNYIESVWNILYVYRGHKGSWLFL